MQGKNSFTRSGRSAYQGAASNWQAAMAHIIKALDSSRKLLDLHLRGTA
jgi:uncharacterized protein YukE